MNYELLRDIISYEPVEKETVLWIRITLSIIFQQIENMFF